MKSRIKRTGNKSYEYVWHQAFKKKSISDKDKYLLEIW